MQSDLERMEEGGQLSGVNTEAVSDRAFERSRDQLGTLGSGNHFVEVQVVDQIFDEDVARVMGLVRGNIAVMIHSGSRGFGYEICSDQLRSMGQTSQKYGIRLVDRQLACAPITSPEGERYKGVMSAAANYAWANRIILCLLYTSDAADE